MATPGAAPQPQPKPYLAFGLLAAFTVAFMAAAFALGIRSTLGQALSPEHYASRLTEILPLGYAFGAGVVASVNPCGFLMLPAFVGYTLGLEQPSSNEVTYRQLVQSILFGLAVTAGFVALFAAVGGVVASGGSAILSSFPWIGLAVGIGLTLLGLWVLATGRLLSILVASRIWNRVPSSPATGLDLRRAFLFGIAYAVASLSCTLPIFLVVVATSLTNQGLLHSLWQFISFALGMGAVVVAVSLSAVAFRGAVAQALKGLLPYVQRLSAIFLVGAGVYLIVYWVVLGGIF